MTLLWMDGIDNYRINIGTQVDEELIRRYSDADGSIVIVEGRFPTERTGGEGRAIRFSRRDDDLKIDNTSGSDTYYIGFGFQKVRPVSPGFRTNINNLLVIGNQVSLDLDEHLRLRLESAGGSSVSSQNKLKFRVWYFIEIKVKIDASFGEFELRVNDEIWFSENFLDTQSQATKAVPSFIFTQAFNNPGNIRFHYIDDIYVCDKFGSFNNDFLGDTAVETVLPDANGDLTQWAVVGSAATNFRAVDERSIPPANLDDNFVRTVNSGNTDLYEFQDLALITGEVNAVEVNHLMRQDNAGDGQQHRIVIRRGSDAFGPDQQAPVLYRYRSRIFEQDPTTSSSWTETTINATQFGLESRP